MNHRARPIPDSWPTRRIFVPQGCDQQGREEPTIQPAPAESCTELGHDDGEPVTGIEALKVWLVMALPSLGMVALLAALLWAFKP